MLFEVYYTNNENSELNKYDTEYLEYSKNTIFNYINSILLTHKYSDNLELKLKTFNSFIKMIEKYKVISETFSDGDIAREFLISTMKM